MEATLIKKFRSKSHPSNRLAVRDVNYNMKIIPAILLLTSALVLSCDDYEVSPSKAPLVLPLRMELDGYKREFTFDAANRVTFG